jgi:hypothetical protein
MQQQQQMCWGWVLHQVVELAGGLEKHAQKEQHCNQRPRRKPHMQKKQHLADTPWRCAPAGGSLHATS